jgi:hypothetical protein
MRSIHSFFREYGDLSLGDDPQAIAACYTESFIAAGPKGSMSFKNDKKFIKWLKQVKEFNAKTGMQDLKVIKVKSTAIGNFCTSATVTWAAVFEKRKAEPVKFDITYFLYHPEDTSPKIMMYISHEDQEEVMKEKGLN